MKNMITATLVDHHTKRHLILILYSILESKEMSYAEIHLAAKKFQYILERDHDATLGYSFKDSYIDSTWDNEFQQDIESYEALGRLIVNRDVTSSVGFYKQRLELTEGGRFLVQTTVRYNLEKQFGKGIVEKLTEEAKRAIISF